MFGEEVTDQDTNLQTGIFLQERPPAAPPGKDQHLIYLRFRYVFSLYVVVQPVVKQAELLNKTDIVMSPASAFNLDSMAVRAQDSTGSSASSHASRSLSAAAASDRSLGAKPRSGFAILWAVIASPQAD